MDDTTLAPINLDVQKTVRKSNILNELRNANASLVEYRLFCVYLAHLPMKSNSNVVTFTLADYAKIAGLKRPRADDLEEQSDNLLDMKARIPTQDGGFRKLNIFSEFSLFKKDGEWMVSLECTQNIAPMIREQSRRYLRYKLYNTIFLKSYNQQRLYELLKQYEKIGWREIALTDLREFLSIEDHQYPVWYDFSSKVLKVAQKALRESTDICFEFEPIRANKRGKPVVAVKFTITENRDFVDRLQIEQHMPNAGEAGDYDGAELYKRAPGEIEGEPQMSLFGIADVAESICSKFLPKFTKGQIQEVAAAVMGYFAALLPDGVMPSQAQVDAYIRQLAAKLADKRSKEAVPYPARYVLKIIRTDTTEACANKQESPGEPPAGERELDEDDVRAIQRMMSEPEPEPATVGNDPALAARAAELQKSIQGK